MNGLNGKIALVTGAGRGIGAATAKKLTESGAKVLVNDLDEEVAQSVASALPGAIAHTGDLTDLKMGDELVEKAVTIAEAIALKWTMGFTLTKIKIMRGKTINKCMDKPSPMVNAYIPSSLKIDKPVLDTVFVINPKTPIGAHLIIN